MESLFVNLYENNYDNAGIKLHTNSESNYYNLETYQKVVIGRVHTFGCVRMVRIG